MISSSYSPFILPKFLNILIILSFHRFLDRYFGHVRFPYQKGSPDFIHNPTQLLLRKTLTIYFLSLFTIIFTKGNLIEYLFMKHAQLSRAELSALNNCRVPNWLHSNVVEPFALTGSYKRLEIKLHLQIQIIFMVPSYHIIN